MVQGSAHPPLHTWSFKYQGMRALKCQQMQCQPVEFPITSIFFPIRFPLFINAFLLVSSSRKGHFFTAEIFFSVSEDNKACAFTINFYVHFQSSLSECMVIKFNISTIIKERNAN